jgi:hypothetical protein
MPNDAKIEKVLRSEVQKLFSANDTDNVTVKRVRVLAEQTLELEEGWFKNHMQWKDKSKEIIVDEAVCIATIVLVTQPLIPMDAGHAIRSPRPETERSTTKLEPSFTSADQEADGLAGSTEWWKTAEEGGFSPGRIDIVQRTVIPVRGGHAKD